MLHPSEPAQWLAARLNRPFGSLDERAFWALYEQAGVPLSSAPASLGPAELLIVLTTYRRPEACERLIKTLHASARRAGAVPCLLVLNDRSEADYAAARASAERLFGPLLTWLDARERLGKPGFWKAYQTAFLAARTVGPAHALFVQDDIEFEPSLIEDARLTWARLSADPARRVLYLFSGDDDERWGRWTFYPRTDVGLGLRRTQWFDLQAFLVDRAFFELLAYRMIPIHPNRWRRRPRISSGVGQQLTVRLRGRANVYQAAYPPLVRHGGHGSEMNPEARRRRPLDNRP